MIDSISMAATHRVWGVEFGLLVRCKSIHTINGAYDALVLFFFLLQDMCRGNYLSSALHRRFYYQQPAEGYTAIFF